MLETSFNCVGELVEGSNIELESVSHFSLFKLTSLYMRCDLIAFAERK
jgi:hypothetical protein